MIKCAFCTDPSVFYRQSLICVKAYKPKAPHELVHS